MQGHGHAGRRLNPRNTFQIEALFSHRRDKPVHIPDSRRQDTNLGGLCKLPRPGGRCEDKQALRDRVVNFGPSADIPSSPLTPRSELIARTSPSIWVNAARGDEHARQ